MEGTVGSDAGAQIRDGIKSVASQGDCPESLWTYDDTPADPNTGVLRTNAKAATVDCYVTARQYEALQYQSVDQNLADLKGCLAEGFPAVFGFTVDLSFESAEVASTGDVPMPGTSEALIGGHAVLAVGYDDEDQLSICRNSWGPGWGDADCFYMHYAYLPDNNLSSDFSKISVMGRGVSRGLACPREAGRWAFTAPSRRWRP